MSNHSRRQMFGQDVVCTALGCAKDVDPRFHPNMICAEHAIKVFLAVEANRDFIHSLSSKRWEEERAALPPQLGLKQRLAAQAVVYYIQFGQGIKIGTTTNMKQRLNAFALPESAVLATEPGGMDLERSRHQFFKDTRIPGSEIFRDSPKLQKHIEAVKRYHGEPKITSYLPAR